jgi:hypothetical protein
MDVGRRAGWGICGFQTGSNGGHRRRTSRRAAQLATALATAVSGCATLGPPTLREARTAYNEAVADTGRQQTLMNIVRVHNNENPLFMEVTQISDLSTLSFNPSSGITGFWSKAGPAASLNGTATYTQNPNIQMTPLQGQELIQQISTPITTDSMASLYNSNWPIANILEFAVQRLTPGFGDQSAAENRIAALDDLGALNLASTVSDLTNKAAPAKPVAPAGAAKKPAAAPAAAAGGGDTGKVADTLSLYFMPRDLFTYNRASQPTDTATARFLWQSLRAFYRGTQPSSGDSERIELRVVPRSSQGLHAAADLSPVVSTRSAFGALKSALEGGPAAVVGFVSPQQYRGIHDSALNSKAADCPSGVFYTLTLEQAADIKKVAVPWAGKVEGEVGASHYSAAIVGAVEKAIERISVSHECFYSMMQLTHVSDPIAEQLLDDLREFILVIEADAPPADAFAAWTERGRSYYIAGDDSISQKNLMLLNQFLTIESTATPPPSTTAIVVQ